MLTKNEISTLNLSPTKKDFVQIWNELLEISGKLSERWDPTSTNESDPGIVILKALTGIADKLNYNIDKNTLEAFMPTAAQEDSMRKLCDMLGYNMKYYQSAKTDVLIKYHNSDPTVEEAAAINNGLLIPKFTVITNTDQDISYFTINQMPVYITSTNPSCTIECMEGQLVKCESVNDNYSITINQLSENNRFYLPETQIAENGIFIYNIFYDEKSGVESLSDGAPWEKVENLNTQPGGSRVYKFGFDSYEGRPYVEFPEDCSELFNDGLFIYYTRTNGTNGNISPHTLAQLEVPNLDGWSDVSSESFTADNIFAATTGMNPETIQQAYNNFKKTVGTFDTLVTCRDYMNKVYNMLDSNGKHYLSNALVTDIRNDINKAVTICSCDDAGIFYKETSFKNTKKVLNESTKPVFATNAWYLGSEQGMKLTKTNFIAENSGSFDSTVTGTVEANTEKGFWTITQKDTEFCTNLPCLSDTESSAIDHFDLILYPFKTYTQIKNNVEDIGKVYDASFSYSDISINEVINKLKDSKVNTIAHNIKTPEVGDIISINNYLRLNATIATNNKVTVEEGTLINENIKIALANAFNMHELDFGEEIPFDSIVEVIEQADSRIRVASLNEPALYTTFSVIQKIDSGVPKIVEYAVASDWLDLEDDTANSRFTYTEIIDGKETTCSSFNTIEAKKIFNKLALRNVLAGRVPLFKYNTTFKTNFSEGPYQELSGPFNEKPVEQLPEPTNNQKTIWTDENDIYLGCIENDKPAYYKVTTPDTLLDSIVAPSENENLTDINTFCKLSTKSSTFSDLRLGSGEFVKFRAPNFTTVKTYPAYVNYHLDLDTELAREAVAAEATSLFNILDEDRGTWTTSNTQVRWQKVLDYFGNIDASNKDAGIKTSYKKSFTLEQKISKYSEAASTGEAVCPSEDNPTGQHVIDEVTGKCKYCGVTMMSKFHSGPIVIKIKDNNTDANQEYSAEQLLNFSGCVKLVNEGFKARLAWTDEDGDVIPGGEVPLEIQLELDTPFITNYETLANIQDYVNAVLDEYRSKVNKDTNAPMLPTACAWKIYFDFECVPFLPASLNEWEKFIRYCASNFNNNSAYSGLLKYRPIDENNVILWRLFDGSYDIGKYITNDGKKLLAFDKNYFGLLPTSYLNGIYLIENIGKNAEPAIINNEEEYQLKANEYLYIEYTPSTTTADGTAQEAAAVTEIHGPGTIIKPKGFEVGIMDSDVYTQLGTSPYKTVSFELKDKSHRQIPMHRFGANEQVEIRDFAKVELSKNTFKASPEVWIYKNFNNCDELENGINTRTYTLKEGEYIFYTDKNKAELAYFTSGTQVTLQGNVRIPSCDIIDIATIFDSGIEVIPFKYLALSDSASVIFQEFQYITLGNGDVIKNITLSSNQNLKTETDKDGNVLTYIDESWQKCKAVEYSVASDTSKILTLPKITVIEQYNTDTQESNYGQEDNGWEVCSVLELDVSPSNAQVLRKFETSNGSAIETSIAVTKRSTGGERGGDEPEVINFAPTAKEYPLSFKTNLTCRTSSNSLNIDDVYYNSKRLSSFQFKFFAEEQPLIVKTTNGQVIPFGSNDLCNWSGETLDSKSYLDIWNQVGLAKIKENVVDTDGIYDNALKLSACVSNNTYGIFSIYLQYADGLYDNNRTWIQVIPGTDPNTIKIFNSNECLVEDRLYLHPGINCICINKTCQFFIKTVNGSQGTIFFDDLRLVDCSNVAYVIGDPNSKNTVYEKTYGLNIEQIGFIPIEDGDTDTILLNSEDIDTLQKQLVDKTEKELLVHSAENKKIIDSDTKILTRIEKELNLIVEDVLNGFKDENKRNKAITLYNSINSLLVAETELLDALNTDNVIEKQLATLITQLSTKELTQEQLLNELASIKNSIKDSIEKLSDEEIQSLYNTCEYSPARLDALAAIKAGESYELPNYWQEIVELAKQLNEKSYLSKRKDLITELEQAVAAEDREKVEELITKLKNDNRNINQTKLVTLVNKLKSTFETDDLLSLVNTAIDAALIPDNKGVVSALTELKAKLHTNNKKPILDELDTAITNNEDTVLKELLAELSNIITGDDDNSTGEDEITAAIETLLDYVTPLHSSETVDSIIINGKSGMAGLKDISNSINDLYNNKALSIIENIETMLEEDKTTEEASVEKALALLTNDIKSSDITTITKLVSNISSLKETFIENDSELVAAIDEWPQKSPIKSKDFINSAIAIYWPEKLINKVYTLIDELAIVDAIMEPPIDGIASNIKSNLLYKFDSTVYSANFSTIIDKEVFIKLFDEIENLWLVESKNASFINDTYNILKVFINADEITSKIRLLANYSDDNRIAPVIKILKEIAGASSLSTYTFEVNSLLEKPSLFVKLRNELTNNKTINEQLLGVLKTNIYPNIDKLEKELNISNLDKVADESVYLTNILSRVEDTILFNPDIKEDSVMVNVLVEYADAINGLKNKVLIDTSKIIPSALQLKLPDTEYNIVKDLVDLIELQKQLNIINESGIKVIPAETNKVIIAKDGISSEQLISILDKLASDINALRDRQIQASDEDEKTYKVLAVERQLLAELAKNDPGKDFYYTVSIEPHMAIDFIESEKSKNTLLNPRLNYDINNVNNSFVVSKLDINYLTDGIQLARSSRLN